MRRSSTMMIAAGSLLIVGSAVAQMSDHSDHSTTGKTSGQASKDDQSPASQAFRDANDRMHRDMTMTFTGDADVDFIKGMLPHHQGAVDMAKIVLRYGKDPAVRKLAEEIITAQNTEIGWMTSWLEKRGK